MSGIQSFNPTALNLTERAMAKVRALVEEEGSPDLKLRVFVTGGGCSGFQYGFAFEEVMSEDDSCLEFSDVKVLVDSLSYQYLTGSEVDYEEGLQGSRFVVNNPNASATCGCGSSFSL